MRRHDASIVRLNLGLGPRRRSERWTVLHGDGHKEAPTPRAYAGAAFQHLLTDKPPVVVKLIA